jgi:hypothetical protein
MKIRSWQWQCRPLFESNQHYELRLNSEEELVVYKHTHQPIKPRTSFHENPRRPIFCEKQNHNLDSPTKSKVEQARVQCLVESEENTKNKTCRYRLVSLQRGVKESLQSSNTNPAA